jgi:hypothetical protein
MLCLSFSQEINKSFSHEEYNEQELMMWLLSTKIRLDEMALLVVPLLLAFFLFSTMCVV